MRPFRWSDIDHRLVVLKSVNMGEEMRSRLKADESRIRFENRLNMNGNTVHSLILRMKVEHADEWARRQYEIYCEVWQTQGYVKSAAFVRSVGAHIVRMLEVRARSIANAFSRFVRHTNLPFGLRTAHLKGLDLRMRQLRGRWQRRIEIEAKECEHAERQLRVSQQAPQNARLATKEKPREKIAEFLGRPLKGGSQPAPGSMSMPTRRKPGRSQKLPEVFVVLAGTLWRRAMSLNQTKVPTDQLVQIASSLDSAGHAPPGSYLEGKYARDLKDFNSRNSKSKIGPLKTWSQLVSHGDKEHLQGMRRLLSRCAEKVKEVHPPSGN